LIQLETICFDNDTLVFFFFFFFCWNISDGSGKSEEGLRRVVNLTTLETSSEEDEGRAAVYWRSKTGEFSIVFLPHCGTLKSLSKFYFS
jgi:hypothetical protein